MRFGDHGDDETPEARARENACFAQRDRKLSDLINSDQGGPCIIPDRWKSHSETKSFSEALKRALEELGFLRRY